MNVASGVRRRDKFPQESPNVQLLTPNPACLYKNGFRTKVKIEINDCIKI
jgi:hypothetical protein